MSITRIAVAIYGLLFAALGVGFWVAPERLAQRFDIEALGLVGLSTLRGDFGGVFLALSALCLVGLWTRRRSMLTAAALVLGVIVTGRLVGWAATGDPAGLIPNLPIEIVAVVVLVLHARGLKRSEGEAARPVLARTLAIGAGVALVLGGLLALASHNTQIQDRLFAQAVRHNMGRDNGALMKDDALRVALCGTSAPLPTAGRAKACVMVIAGGRFYIVDVGPESVENLMQWGLPLDRIGGVLVTHFHSDHIGDLGELNLQTWAQGRPGPLAVYGGPGVERVVAGFNEAYSLDQVYRSAHHTPQQMPPATWPLVARPVAMPAGVPAPTAVVLDDGKLRITAIETNHDPVRPAYAYRFDYKGRSVVITGDTAADPRLIAAARGADIFLSEALNREMISSMEKVARDTGRGRIAHIMADIQSYHISPTEAAETANKAGVKLLVLYHLLPAPDNFMLSRIFIRGLDDVRRGDWDLADDGSLYTLPVGSAEVRIGHVPQ